MVARARAGASRSQEPGTAPTISHVWQDPSTWGVVYSFSSFPLSGALAESDRKGICRDKSDDVGVPMALPCPLFPQSPSLLKKHCHKAGMCLKTNLELVSYCCTNHATNGEQTLVSCENGGLLNGKQCLLKGIYLPVHRLPVAWHQGKPAKRNDCSTLLA